MKNFFHNSKRYHLEGSMFDHVLLALKKLNRPDLDLIYAIIFHDVGKPHTAKKVLKDEGWVTSTKGHASVSAELFKRFAKKYKFSKKSQERIEWAIRNHMHAINFTKWDPKQQLSLAKHPEFSFLIQLWQADFRGNLRTRELNSLSSHAAA